MTAKVTNLEGELKLRDFLWRNRDTSHLMSVSERPGIFCKSGILLVLVTEPQSAGWGGGAMSATVSGNVTVKKPKNTSSATRHCQRQPLTVMRCDVTTVAPRLCGLPPKPTFWVAL